VQGGDIEQYELGNRKLASGSETESFMKDTSYLEFCHKQRGRKAGKQGTGGRG